MNYLKFNDKVIGFYCCNEKDKNGLPYKLYCYVVKDRKGEISYSFTTEQEEITEAFLNYANKNGYKRTTKDNIFTDNLDKVNINCADAEEIYDRIRRANPDDEIDYDEFMDAKDDIVKTQEKKGFISRAKEKVSSIIDGAKEKLAQMNPKTKKLAIRVTAIVASAAVIVGGVKLFSNRSNGPTATNSKIASTVDDNINDLDNLDEFNKTVENAVNENLQEQKKEEAAKQETTSVTYDTSNDYSSSNRSSTSGSNSSSSNSSRRPSGQGGTNNQGGTNDDILGFQDPNESIDNSDQNSGSNNGDSNNQDDNIYEEEKPDESLGEDNDYSEVIEGEVPSDQEDNTDDDYTDEIVVEPDDDVSDNENTDEIIIDPPTDDNVTDETPSDDETNEDEDDLTSGDIILDEDLIGNEDAIDDDISYEGEEEYTPLPDPGEAASDGNYVNTEDDLSQGISEPTEEIEIVPVEQETTDENYYIYDSYTPDTMSSTENTTSNDNYDNNAKMVEQAIEAMANGEDVNLVYNTNGSISIEENTNTATNSEAMVK